MTANTALNALTEAMILVMILSLPPIAVASLVGIIVSLLQALTQVQEATLVYAPKILAIFISLLVFLPLMGALLTGFMRHIAERISSL